MYAESIINERLEIASQELGYCPEYHSIAEVDEFIARIDASMKMDNTGKSFFSRDLTPEEFRFMQGERILCMCDAEYWLTRYAWLSDENSNAVRFQFRGAQPIFFSVVAELEAQHAAIELLIAKARQQYITTLSQLLVIHRPLFHHYTYGIVASADATKSGEMAEKAFFTYDHLPWWLKPKPSRRVEGVPGLLKFDTMESRIGILHGATSAKSKGAQKTGLARGSTPSVYHISEVAHFPDAEQTIEAALFGGVHANPKIFGVLESTFAGPQNWFAKRYKSSKEGFSKGESRSRALFFNFPFAREIYPTPTWWRTHRQYMPHNWVPDAEVAAQIMKAELFIQDDPLLSKFMGRNWTMPIEQKWFYNFRYTEAKKNGTLATLYQELPCDDIEALQSSYDNVFGNEVIRICHNEREKDYDVYGVVGQAIDDRFEPSTDEIDYDRRRIPLNHKLRNGTIYQWELIPIKRECYTGATGDESERDAVSHKLFVYKHPEPGRDYSLGGDSAKGGGHDASVVSVNLIGAPSTPDVQVAEWRSHYVSHVELFAFMLPIALYYRDHAREHMGWPKLAVEQVESVGDVCQNELRKLGYPVNRMHRFGQYDGIETKRLTNKVGWFTTGWSRPILIGHFVHAVKNGWYVPNSPWTIEECAQFEVHYTTTGKERLEHANNYWDDGIFASAISYFIVHDMDSLAERSKKQVRGVEQAIVLPDVEIGKNTGWSVNPDSPMNRPMKLDDVIRYGAQLDRFRR